MVHITIRACVGVMAYVPSNRELNALRNTSFSWATVNSQFSVRVRRHVRMTLTTLGYVGDGGGLMAYMNKCTNDTMAMTEADELQLFADLIFAPVPVETDELAIWLYFRFLLWGPRADDVVMTIGGVEYTRATVHLAPYMFCRSTMLQFHHIPAQIAVDYEDSLHELLSQSIVFHGMPLWKALCVGGSTFDLAAGWLASGMNEVNPIVVACLRFVGMSLAVGHVLQFYEGYPRLRLTWDFAVQNVADCYATPARQMVGGMPADDHAPLQALYERYCGFLEACARMLIEEPDTKQYLYAYLYTFVGARYVGGLDLKPVLENEFERYYIESGRAREHWHYDFNSIAELYPLPLDTPPAIRAHGKFVGTPQSMRHKINILMLYMQQMEARGDIPALHEMFMAQVLEVLRPDDV